ncbi:MAG: cation:proton antiporter [Gammaproteobacteria bacterium]|nr:cation:proton antiporter [Gammaproteobacteria bacterium]
MSTLLVSVAFVCIALGALRFVRGPTHADSIIALDILFAAGVALCTAAALYTQRVLFLDIAIGVTLIGFVTTLAWARLVELRSDARKPSDTQS